MALTPRLEIRQTQSLVMTPQLQQAIRLLQYSSMDLSSFILEEVEKNPLLEIGENSPAPEKNSPDNAETTENTDAAPTADDFLKGDNIDNQANDAPLDTNYDNVYNNDSPSDQPAGPSNQDLGYSGANSIKGGGGGFEEGESSLENRMAEVVSLQEHLLDELNIMHAAPREKIVIQYLVGMLDEAGYIKEDISLIAEQLGCDTAEIEQVLELAQTMEPVGVFARSLSECLKLQQRELDRLDPAMEIFLDNLDMLAKRDYNGLKRLCKVDTEDLKDMIEEIQALNPKPGLKFGGEMVQTVIPDVFVRKGPKGAWTVELNSDTLPKVLLNNSYYAEVKDRPLKEQDKEYLNECMATANWLIKALDQRARTILKVSSELVRLQKDFLDKGIRYLKPLNLRTIAEAIDMHESTVSRVTANKYITTNRGIFEMKYFFTTGISSTEDGEDHSAISVKHMIKSLINDESPKKILSDDKLVELLKGEDIDIARRTVAKYRESMNISSSIQRRRIKNSTL